MIHMVNKITLEDMMPENTAAEELCREVSGGKGTPLERRLADALVENSKNCAKQNELMAALANTVAESSERAMSAANDASEAARAASSISDEAVRAVRQGTLTAVTQAIPAEVDDLIRTSRKKLSEAGDEAASRIEEAGLSASESIKRSQAAADERERRAKKKDGLASLTVLGKALYLIVTIGAIALIAFAGWKCLPIVTGEAEIIYAESYRGKLDEVRIELIKTKNELDAYKEAYPEGLAEQRLHNLNEKNAKDIRDYEG